MIRFLLGFALGQEFSQLRGGYLAYISEETNTDDVLMNFVLVKTLWICHN